MSGLTTWSACVFLCVGIFTWPASTLWCFDMLLCDRTRDWYVNIVTLSTVSVMSSYVATQCIVFGRNNVSSRKPPIYITSGNAACRDAIVRSNTSNIPVVSRQQCLRAPRCRWAPFPIPRAREGSEYWTLQPSNRQRGVIGIGADVFWYKFDILWICPSRRMHTLTDLIFHKSH